MEMINKYGRRILVCLIILSFLCNGWICVSANRSIDTTGPYSFTKPSGITRSDNYNAYIREHGDRIVTKITKHVAANEYTHAEHAEVKNGYMGYTKPAVATYEDSFIEWTVEVPQDALYQIEIDYCAIKGKNRTIKRELTIDGKHPFYEALNICFERTWKDAGPIVRDQRGNDITPGRIEEYVWKTKAFEDMNGYYDEPYFFFLTKGQHTIRLKSLGEPMVIGELRLTGLKAPLPYKEVLAAQKAQGAKEATGKYSVYEAEESKYKSSPTLYPVFDKSSPATSPSSYAKLRLNTIGGTSWQYPGDWISWEIDVPEEGFYKIALRARQNISSGFFSSRKLYIDGEVPFSEARSIRFTYDDAWRMITLGDEENGDYLFYLTKGKHEVRLEATLGGIRNIIAKAEAALSENNAIYREILMLTGSEPDIYRDYDIQKQLPHLVDNLTAQQKVISDTISELVSLSLKRGESISALEKLNYRLTEMIKDPEKIPSYLIDYKNCLAGLGTWLLTAKQQPLELDYIVVAPVSAGLPRANAGIFKSIWYKVMSFISSYFEDYNAIGDLHDRDKAINVWIGVGRDQAQIIKKLIDRQFTPDTNIRVNLSLVNMATSLLPATLAGRGPDVALQISQSDAINYAIRGAAVDLTQYDGFNDVKRRFYDSAIAPFSFNGKVYGLPETQSFPMMFYRKDILAELGIEALDTWDDVYQVIPVLQKKYFNFGLPAANMTSMGIFLYQNEGGFYSEDQTASGLDSETGMAAFKKWTQFYTSYGVPLAYDFATRFRIGEMPVAIADYTMYNLLSVFAPEIDGLWGFVPIPGTVDSNGRINRAVPGVCTGSMVLGTSKKKEEAWEFIKWWSGTENQVSYGQELENVMGVAARYPTANIEAMKETPWSMEELEAINAQWKSVREIPEVPGGYYTARQIDYAWRNVVISGGQPRDTLYDYVKYINQEIYSKRKEFGLSAD